MLVFPVRMPGMMRHAPGHLSRLFLFLRGPQCRGKGFVMKKIILLDRLKQNIGLDLLEVFSDFDVLTAYSNEDALRLHRKEKAALIITELYGSGMNAREFCSRVRDDGGLRQVSIIVYCRDNEVELKEARQCRANAVLTLPLRGSFLLEKARQFLSISTRGSFHAEFSARTSRVPGLTIDCRTENISVTGMLIKADAELHRGDLLQYSLSLAPARSFAMQGEVVRNEQGRYGIRFSRLDHAARSAIEVLVSQHASGR